MNQNFGSGPDEEGPFLRRAGDFLREVGQPVPALVDDTIPFNSLLLLTAKPKYAKTYLGMDIMECVERGSPVMGRFAVNKPGPVVYLGMEDGKWEINNRLRQRGMDDGDTRDIYICDHYLDLSTPEGIGRLAREMAPIQPVLIWIDTAQEALRVANWNNRTEVSTKLRPLRDFAHENCSVVMAHHNRKQAGAGGDEIAGGTGLTASVDGWLSIHRKQVMGNGDLRLWIRREGRGGLRGEIVADMDTETLRFSLVEGVDAENDEAERQSKFVTQMKRFLPIARAVLRAGGRATVQQISECCDLSYKTAQTLVREMREHAMLEDFGDREGKKRNVVVYRLTARMDEWTRDQPPNSEPNYDHAAAMFANWGENNEMEDEGDDE